MTIEEFSAEIDKIEIDPRPGLKLKVARIADVELASIPTDLKARILAATLPNIVRLSRELIESGALASLGELVTNFALDLRRRVNYERTSGSLKAITRAAELGRVHSILTANGWNPWEQDGVFQLMRDGDRVGLITPRQIEMHDSDRSPYRRITRSDFEALRPPGWSNSGSWEEQFTSEAQIREIEEAQRQEATPTRLQSFNTDYPDGVRPR